MIGTRVQIRRPHKRAGVQGVIVQCNDHGNGLKGWWLVRTEAGAYWLAREQFTIIDAARAA